jgi:hypothetical protein|tara:strand:- start:4375 stop:5220 length:846 start_codon:yes stop_codon:yes gene_type:complete
MINLKEIQPIIIIGSPRSGTNLLRNTLVQFNKVCTWPFDEINFMWMKGHKINRDDELKVEDLSQKKINYLKHEFLKIALKNNSNIVVEKTCANSLRIPYIYKIFPNAKFICIHRDPIDAIDSIEKKWKEGRDINNFFKKIFWFNKSYLIKFLIYNLSKKFFNLKNRFDIWGPKIKNLNKIINENNNLLSIAAYQWKRCFKLAQRDLKEINQDNVFSLKYEDFVENPHKWISKILIFMNVEYDDKIISRVSHKISRKNIGKGRNSLTENHILEIEKILALDI